MKSKLLSGFFMTGILVILSGFKNAPDKNTVVNLNNWSEWSDESLRAIEYMILNYGQPDEKGERMAIWYNCKPWKWSIVHRDAINHEFPETHKDVLEQCIDYRVPYYLLNEISKFNGSIECSRTRGEVTVRCANEALNFLSVNLVSDIVNGRKNAKTAREYFAAAAGKYMNGGGKDIYMKSMATMKQWGVIPDPDSRVQPEVRPGSLSTK